MKAKKAMKKSLKKASTRSAVSNSKTEGVDFLVCRKFGFNCFLLVLMLCESMSLGFFFPMKMIPFCIEAIGRWSGA